MANYSPELQAIESLISQASPDRGARLIPGAVHRMAASGDSQTPAGRLFLHKTASFPSVPNFGNACVAVYRTSEPAVPVDKGSDEKHQSCDVGILIRQLNLDDPEELAEAIRVTKDRRLSVTSARVAELLVPVLEKAPEGSVDHAAIAAEVLVPTGYTEVFARAA
jgi:hypothetical protein